MGLSPVCPAFPTWGSDSKAKPAAWTPPHPILRCPRVAPDEHGLCLSFSPQFLRAALAAWAGVARWGVTE